MVKITTSILLVLLVAAPARADELLFKNGDRWSGKLVSLVEGKIRFKTDLVGELVVVADEVRTLATDEPIEIHMQDGTTLVEVVNAAETGAGSFETRGETVSGVLTLALAEMTSINPPEPEWKGRALVGAELERGNTIKDSVYAELNMRFEGPIHRITTRANYDSERTTNTSTRENTTQDRNIFGRVRYENLFSERNYWWVGTSAEKDGPSDLDLRFYGGAGLGRDFLQRPGLRLSAFAGPTFISEQFKDDADDEQRVAGQLGWDAFWNLTGSLELFSEGTYIQAGKDDILVKSEIGLRDNLTSRIFVEGKILWEYDSEPAQDAERQDVDYVLGIGYRF